MKKHQINQNVYFFNALRVINLHTDYISNSTQNRECIRGFWRQCEIHTN